MRDDRFTNKCIFKKLIKKQKTGTPARLVLSLSKYAALALCSGLLAATQKNDIETIQLHTEKTVD
ncbi:hypothetical protein MED134_15309 [Dokdonia sp. MED134]|nr:hypothetical protein MED134_15309 [Dokdonia sp. MED134]